MLLAKPLERVRSLLPAHTVPQPRLAPKCGTGSESANTCTPLNSQSVTVFIAHAGSDQSTSSQASQSSGLNVRVPRVSSDALSSTSATGSDTPTKSPTFMHVTQTYRSELASGSSPEGSSAAPSESESASASQTLPRRGLAEQVFVRASAPADPHEMGSQLLSMEVGNLPQRDGDRCNIEFSFELGVDSVQQVIAEMQRDLNLDLGEADTKLIEDKIDFELQRCGHVVACCAGVCTPLPLR